MPNLAANLRLALDWLQGIIAQRFQIHAGHPGNVEIAPPDFHPTERGLAHFTQQLTPTPEELGVLTLALAPTLLPHFLNQILAEHLPEGGDFPEFGGVRGSNHRGLLPTGETAQFILAGDDLEKRLEVQRLFSSDHWFAKEHLSPKANT